MESRKNNHGRNHGCKGSIHRYHMLVIKEIVIITRSFHDRIYSVSMGMNTKVQGRLPLLQCITFNSLIVFEEFVVRKIYLVKHQKSMTHISFEFTRIREGVGSTHQGILGTYTTNFGVNITSSKVDHRSKADDTIYQRHYIPMERLIRLFNRKDTVG